MIYRNSPYKSFFNVIYSLNLQVKRPKKNHKLMTELLRWLFRSLRLWLITILALFIYFRHIICIDLKYLHNSQNEICNSNSNQTVSKDAAVG